MERIKYLCLFLFAFFITLSNAQTVIVNGVVVVDDEDIEGVHVINKTASKFTITNSNGEFIIPIKLYDTLVFSAIKYKPKEVVVNYSMINSKVLKVFLIEMVTELNEVIIGKVLTGNLLSDIENSDAKRDINFYDLGIQGYTGKPFTQSERRLNEATTGGGIVPLNPLINAITGRTKMLKNQIKLERFDVCLDRIKSNLSDTFFTYNLLEEALRIEFFFYCSEDERFSSICKVKNDITTLEFLKTKLEQYKKNLQN